MITEIDVEELKRQLDAKEDFVLVDVREADEYEFCRIEGSTHIPLSTFRERFEELSPDKKIVIHCHHGGRSMRACEFLLSQGYSDLVNVKGGIDHWSLKIDSKVKRY